MRSLVIVTLLASSLAACDDTKTGSVQTTEPDPNPQVEKNPAPETGTGGEQLPSQPAPATNP